MIFEVYSFRDKKIGAYVNIFLDKFAPGEEKEGFLRSLKACPVEQLRKYLDIDLYHLGSFNDETGEFKTAFVTPVFLCAFDSVVLPLLELAEQKEKVKEETTDGTN